MPCTSVYAYIYKVNKSSWQLHLNKLSEKQATTIGQVVNAEGRLVHFPAVEIQAVMKNMKPVPVTATCFMVCLCVCVVCGSKSTCPSHPSAMFKPARHLMMPSRPSASWQMTAMWLIIVVMMVMVLAVPSSLVTASHFSECPDAFE